MNERTRICYFIGSLKYGGAQKHLVELINNLDEDIFEIFLVLGNEQNGFADQINLDNDHYLSLNINKYYGFDGIRKLFKFIKFIKYNRIDILHSYLFECNVYAAFVKVFMPGVRFIMSIRNMNYTHGKYKVLSTKMASLLANYVTVVCNKVGEYVIERERINPDKIITLYNAVDENIFSFVKNTKSDKTIRIACVASLNYRKGQEYLLQAVQLLCQRTRDVHLYLIGDGKNRANLEKLANDLEISEHVTFTGYISNVRELLQDIDIGVLSSFEEGMSNALLEYMAMGIPSVTTDVGGNHEVNIDGETGFIVQPRSVNELAVAIDKLVVDDDLRNSMGSHAIDRIKMSSQ